MLLRLQRRDASELLQNMTIVAFPAHDDLTKCFLVCAFPSVVSCGYCILPCQPLRSRPLCRNARGTARPLRWSAFKIEHFVSNKPSKQERKKQAHQKRTEQLQTREATVLRACLSCESCFQNDSLSKLKAPAPLFSWRMGIFSTRREVGVLCKSNVEALLLPLGCNAPQRLLWGASAAALSSASPAMFVASASCRQLCKQTTAAEDCDSCYPIQVATSVCCELSPCSTA